MQGETVKYKPLFMHEHSVKITYHSTVFILLSFGVEAVIIQQLIVPFLHQNRWSLK